MDSSAMWVERVVEWDQGSGQGLLSDRSVLYAIESDTMINQERYGKIIKVGSYGEYLDNGQPRKLIPYRTPCYQNCYVGAIRLDTNLNQVLLVQEGQQTPNVLYDFDSLQRPHGVDFDIDSFLFEGLYYNQWSSGGYAVSELTGANTSVLVPALFPFEMDYSVPCIYSPRLGMTDPGCQAIRSFILANDVPSAKELNAYPNPVSNMLTLQLPESGEAGLVLYDLTGKKIREEKASLNGEDWLFSCSYLPSGVYLLHVSLNGHLYQKMMVKE